jgi:DNA-binding transcriptional LysR family regulator
LVRFQKQHPQIEFELYVSDSVTDLIESRIDLAIRVQKPTGAQFVFRKLKQNELIWVASPKYLAGHPVIKRPSDLKQHSLLTLSVYRNCRVGEGVLRVEDISRLTPIRCESGAVLTELALQQAGIALRSTWDVAPLVKSGRLVRVLEKYPVENFGDVFAVTPHARFLTRRVRLFLEFLRTTE